MFQDPTGQHLLVCMESKECYYIGSRLPKRSQPKPLTKVKGQLIESVAWNKVDQNEQSTGAILLGTSTGRYIAAGGAMPLVSGRRIGSAFLNGPLFWKHKS